MPAPILTSDEKRAVAMLDDLLRLLARVQLFDKSTEMVLEMVLALNCDESEKRALIFAINAMKNSCEE